MPIVKPCAAILLAATFCFATTPASALSSYEWFPRRPALNDQLHLVHLSECGDPWVPDTPTLQRLDNPGGHAWILDFDVRVDPCDGQQPARTLYAIAIPASIEGYAVGQLYVQATNAVTGIVTPWVMPTPERVGVPPSVAGTWFNPAFAYQGLLINYTAAGEAAVVWNTYDADGRPSWHTGIGAVPSDTSVMTMTLSDLPSGVFAGAPEQPVAPAAWGTIALEYLGCGELRMDWAPAPARGLQAGSATLQQLTDGHADACNLARWSGRQHAQLVLLEPEVLEPVNTP